MLPVAAACGMLSAHGGAPCQGEARFVSSCRGRGRRVDSSGRRNIRCRISGRPGQDDPAGRRGLGQRRDRRAPGHPARGGQPVAQALLRGATGGPGGQARPGRPRAFPPRAWSLQVKALACELPATLGRAAVALQRGRCGAAGAAVRAWWPRISDSTVWRWLQRGCDSPLAAPLLDLSARPALRRPRPGASSTCTSGAGKGSRCATTSSSSPPTRRPASRRARASIRRLPPAARRGHARRARVRSAAAPGPTWPRWTCIAPRCSAAASATTGIAPFERLVDQVMSQPPYNEARRVFWIMDNGSSHRGAALRCARLQRKPSAPGSRPRPGPRQLAQPDRDLLLDRAAQGAHAQRLPVAGRRRSDACSRSRATTRHRPAVRVEVHAARSCRSAQQAPSRSLIPRSVSLPDPKNTCANL